MKPSLFDDERDELLGQMGQLAHDRFQGGVKPAADARGKRELRVALGADRRRRVGVWGAVAAAAIACGAAAFFTLRSLPSHLSYEIDSRAPSAGGYLQGTKQSPAIARFTDGTEVRVNDGARARVVDVESHGARVALEQGRAHLRVVHLPDAHWSVDAGPFTIAVTGTEFDVDWSGPDGVLVVEMHQGGVVVRGPLATDGIGVRAGQRLVASIADGKLHIEPLGAVSANAAAPAAAAPTATGPATAAAPKIALVEPELSAAVREAQNDEPERDEPALPAERSVARVEPAHRDGPAAPAENAEHEKAPAAQSWARRVASGDFRGVLSDAESKGVSTTLAEAPLGDLVALGDAARYTGSSNIARDALAAQRKRYPSSSDAKAAAFFLGRLAEDRGATGEAIDWYERYLSEAPRGAFAAEALGREMLAARKGRGNRAAAAVAERYLDRFPGGPYAARARELVAAP
jgi:TolA-binding protein